MELVDTGKAEYAIALKKAVGRPKKSTGTAKEWDARVTPVDGEPIDFQPNTDDFEVCVAAREGGTAEKRLHYHLYIKTIRSETWLRSWLSKMGRSTDGTKGNAVYSLRNAHEGTIGYVVKEGDIKCRLGWTDMFLEEMIRKSNQYRKDNEKLKKRASRVKENILAEILKVVAEGVKLDPSPTPSKIMKMILDEYYERKTRFPNRSTLENAVMSLLYPYNAGMVLSYYTKNVEERFSQY